MKKMFLFIFSLISFLFFGSSVYAQEISFDLINDDFLSFREEVLNKLLDSQLYYIIQKDDNGFVAHVFSSSLDNCVIDFNGNVWLVQSSYFEFYSYKESSSSGSGSWVINLINKDTNTFNSNLLLDTNYTILLYKDITFTNSLFSLDLKANERILSLYEIKVKYDEFVVDNEEDITHANEMSKVSNFYSVAIDKIGDFANSLSSNYIYLSLFVVVLVTTLIYLVVRRC